MMTCSRDGWQTVGWQEGCRMQPGRTWVGCLPVAPRTEAGAQLHLPAAGRRREERAAHRMHGRRGSNAQRRRHVHAALCHVSYSGRYLPVPIFYVLSSCTLPQLLHVGTILRFPLHLGMPCPRPGQATESRSTVAARSDGPRQPTWANNISQQGVSVLWSPTGSLVSFRLFSLVMTDPTVRLRLASHTRRIEP